MRKIQFLLLALGLIFLSSCLEDPGNPVASASKTTVAVNEEFTLSVSGADNYTCLYWNLNEGTVETANATFKDGNDAEVVTVSIDQTGVYEFMVSVKNCRGEDDPCIGTCRDEYSSVSITVE